MQILKAPPVLHSKSLPPVSRAADLGLANLPRDEVKIQNVRFGNGSGDDPFSYAYTLGTSIKEIATKNPNVDPLQVLVDASGGAFNLYGSHKIDKVLHEIKSSINLLRDANLKAGVEMLDASVEAANKGKSVVAFRDLGFAKNSFALAVNTVTNQPKKALAHEYLAQCYELDGLPSKAKEHRDHAFRILKSDFETKARKFSAYLYHSFEEIETPRLFSRIVGGGLFNFFTTLDTDTANMDARNADVTVHMYAEKYKYNYAHPSDCTRSFQDFTDEYAALSRNLKELAH